MIWTALWCASTACSDDLLGVLGNEQLCWDASERVEYYEVATEHIYCGLVIAPERCVDLWSDCRGEMLVVRACNDYGCSEWSDPIEVLPWVCIEGNQEVPCYDGAPLWLPEGEEEGARAR